VAVRLRFVGKLLSTANWVRCKPPYPPQGEGVIGRVGPCHCLWKRSLVRSVRPETGRASGIHLKPPVRGFSFSSCRERRGFHRLRAYRQILSVWGKLVAQRNRPTTPEPNWPTSGFLVVAAEPRPTVCALPRRPGCPPGPRRALAGRQWFFLPYS
jgi:hypothetical protein